MSEDLDELEDRKFHEWEAAVDEEERLQLKIKEILNTAPDRAEAEKMILQDWAPKLEAASKKAGQLMDEWLALLKKIDKERKKEKCH